MLYPTGRSSSFNAENIYYSCSMKSPPYVSVEIAYFWVKCVCFEQTTLKQGGAPINL